MKTKEYTVITLFTISKRSNYENSGRLSEKKFNIDQISVICR